MNTYPYGTLNLAAIEDAIYDFVNNVTQNVLADSGEIIWRNQSEPLPPRPCVTLKLIDGPSPIGRNGNRSVAMVNGKTIETVGIQMEATLSIQIFGNTKIHRPMAYQLAVDINSSLMLQSVLDGLKLGGVAIQGVGHPKNLTALEETEYEERAGIEILLGLAQNVSDQPTTIGTVNMTGNLDTGQSDAKTVEKQIILP